MPRSLLSRLDEVAHLTVAGPGGSPRDPRPLAAQVESRLEALGLAPGEHLAVVLPNGPEFAAAFIACQRRGLTFVPLPPGLDRAEREERLRTVQASAILTAGAEPIRRLRPAPVGGPAAAVILFTSGTGGVARAIALGEAGLLGVVDSHHAALGYPPGTRIVGCLPWTHAFGFTLELLMGLLGGAVLHSVPPASLEEALVGQRAEFLLAVPRTLSALGDDVLRSLAGGVVGGAPIRGGLRTRLERTRLRVGYGQTECSPGATLGRPGEWERDDFLGRALGCEVALGPADDEGDRELLVRGDNTALAVRDGDRWNPVVDADGWLATGDLALPTDDGGFVFRGRSDERFKLNNGRMVNPVPLERAYGDRVLLIGAGQPAVQPLVRGDIPPDFSLPVPHQAPRSMPESFWVACTTPTGKLSRRRAEHLFAST